MNTRTIGRGALTALAVSAVLTGGAVAATAPAHMSHGPGPWARSGGTVALTHAHYGPSTPVRPHSHI